MIDGKTVIAIVPARAGSKGLPGKNIKMLCGKPLIAWSIERALASKYVDEVVLTTDSDEIAEIGKAYGASVPFIRPHELATDTATTFEVVKHTLEHFSSMNRHYDFVVLLEPTSPLREKDDVDEMLDQFVAQEERFDAIVSLGEVHEHPSIMKRVTNKGIAPFCTELQMKSRRQDNEVAYFPYGVAYIAKSDVLLMEQTFYPKRTTHRIIKRYQCFEIDDIYDFLAIENIMKHEWGLA